MAWFEKKNMSCFQLVTFVQITKYDELAKERIKEELYTEKKLTVEITENEVSQIVINEESELLATSEEIGTSCKYFEGVFLSLQNF